MTEQAWRTLLIEKFMRIEAERTKVKFTDDEVIDGVMNNPPAEAIQFLQSRFPDQIRSLADYQNLVQSDENIYRFVEVMVKDRLPLMKVSQALTSPRADPRRRAARRVRSFRRQGRGRVRAAALRPGRRRGDPTTTRCAPTTTPTRTTSRSPSVDR